MNARLKSLVNASDCVVFMKGSPAAPQCGFSRRLVDLLNGENVDYSTFDILTDSEVREGLKAYSNWPTYPQVYHKGQLVGGLDVIQELKDANELELPKKTDWTQK